MGLYDEVRCEYRLPHPAHQGLVFKTKDLEKLLDEYVITRRGRLVRTKTGWLEPRGCHVVCPIHQDLRVYSSVEVGPEELIDGHVPGEEDLVLLLPTTMGLRRAAQLVGPGLWRSATAPTRWAVPRTRRRSRGRRKP